MITNNVSNWTPTAYRTDGATQATTQAVGDAAQAVATALPPAVQREFQTLVQGDAESLLTPGADGSPPKDLKGALQKLEALAEEVDAFRRLAADPAALAADIISSIFSEERNAEKMAAQMSEMSMEESRMQAGELQNAAAATLQGATENFICACVGGAVGILGGAVSIGGAADELSGLSDLETGVAPDEDFLLGEEGEVVETPEGEETGIEREEGSVDASGKSGGDEVSLDDDASEAPTVKSADSELGADVKSSEDDADDEECLLSLDEQFRVDFARIDARGKIAAGIGQILGATDKIIEGGGGFGKAQQDSTAQLDQAQANLDQAQQQQDQQFYNFAENFLQTTQSFVGAMIEQYSGILQGETGESQAVSKALANI